MNSKEFRENHHCVVPHYACTTSSFVAVLSCNEPLLSIFSAKLSVWYWDCLVLTVRQYSRLAAAAAVRRVATKTLER